MYREIVELEKLIELNKLKTKTIETKNMQKVNFDYIEKHLQL